MQHIQQHVSGSSFELRNPVNIHGIGMAEPIKSQFRYCADDNDGPQNFQRQSAAVSAFWTLDKSGQTSLYLCSLENKRKNSLRWCWYSKSSKRSSAQNWGRILCLCFLPCNILQSRGWTRDEYWLERARESGPICGPLVSSPTASRRVGGLPVRNEAARF